jgi:hypothetical protein
VLNDAFFYRADAIKVWARSGRSSTTTSASTIGATRDVAGDPELQWLGSRAGLRPPAVTCGASPDQIQTIEQLVSTVAPIVFSTAGRNTRR